MKEIISVGVGGLVGSALRYVLSVVISSIGVMWLGTLVVNVVGSLLIGVLIANINPSSVVLYHLCVIGFCGGFTTFSTFSLEAVRLLQAGDVLTALGYIVASALVCVGAAWCGMQIKL